jgi:ribonuclease BN (tRNA processing enzyme)
MRPIMSTTRRNFLTGTTALAATAVLSPWSATRAQTADKRTRLILLGTGGGPRVVVPGRAKPANLLIINGVPYVVDCGEGVARLMVQAGVPLNTLRYVFITHQHSDHNLDYGNLIYDGWAAGLGKPVDAYGPPPIKSMMEAYWQLNRFDIETRVADEGKPDLRKLVTVHEFDKSGLVMQNGDVKVTAAQVRHPPITQAYAYRFDAADRSIVISGDTTYSPELIELARGVDVLVHEVMHLAGLEGLIKRNPNATTIREHLLASHTVTEDVGKVAAAAGVKMLVLSHLVPGDDASLSDDKWLDGVRKHYSGKVVVGQDLMEI